jgi:ribosomal protein S18 acetylase RimI-like enzyme
MPGKTDSLYDLPQNEVAKLVTDQWFEYLSFMGSSPRARLDVKPDCTRMTTGIPHRVLNCVFKMRLEGTTATDERLQKIVRSYKEQRLPASFYTDPDAKPEDLGGRLGRIGLRYNHDRPGMAADLQLADLARASPEGLRITKVSDLAELMTYMSVLTESLEFPMAIEEPRYQLEAALGVGPQLRRMHFLGLLNGIPVATATLFLGSGAAGIYNVGTLHRSRRRGMGAAMTLAAMRTAKAAGYRTAVLQSSSEALAMYEKLGFETVCKYGVYVFDMKG